MNIGAFSKACGIPRTTIRHYERMGLLAPGESPRGNGYRVYGREHVERVGQIRVAQMLGFTIKEIASLIQAWDDGTLDDAEKRRWMTGKIARIDEQMAELSRMRAYLAAKIAWMDAGGVGLPPSLLAATAPALSPTAERNPRRQRQEDAAHQIVLHAGDHGMA